MVNRMSINNCDNYKKCIKNDSFRRIMQAEQHRERWEVRERERERWEFHISINSEANFFQLLRKFRWIFEKILLNLNKNFTQFLRKFYSIFNKILHNFQENFSQFLREFHSTFKPILPNLKKNFMYVAYLNTEVSRNLCTTVDKNNVYLQVWFG